MPSAPAARIAVIASGSQEGPVSLSSRSADRFSPEGSAFGSAGVSGVWGWGVVVNSMPMSRSNSASTASTAGAAGVGSVRSAERFRPEPPAGTWDSTGGVVWCSVIQAVRFWSQRRVWSGPAAFAETGSRRGGGRRWR
ncbi:hypothetical protein GCM10010347_58050 [Streptomyces cirratus]|uniref:Uncharacterized protein n=1 Tax=Streptomyces cirratus TaxID=68187 RepID=A0ABQ3F0L3_9ACTN|nr:hypothetical protein GCM10010347_58050 [Streptomyces cirratus]